MLYCRRTAAWIPEAAVTTFIPVTWGFRRILGLESRKSKERPVDSEGTRQYCRRLALSDDSVPVRGYVPALRERHERRPGKPGPFAACGNY